MTDSLTLLYGHDVQAAKGAGPISMGFLLAHEQIEVSGFTQLVEALESLKDVPNAYVVRGRPIENAPTHIRRRYRNEPQHLIDVPHRWLCVDIDARAVSIDIYADPDAAVASVRASLPEGLSETMCYYALTRRCEQLTFHGHLWFWLDRHYGGVELHRHLAGLCDNSLFVATQPHFTAAPVLDIDPLEGRRRGFLDGTPEGWLGHRSEGLTAEQGAKQLAVAVSEIIAQKKGDRHRTINRHAFHLGRFVASNVLDKKHTIDVLVNASRQAGLDDRRATDEVLRGLNDGQRQAVNRESWEDRLAVSDTGVPKATYANLALALSDSPEWLGTIGWNDRYHQPVWRRNPPIGGFPSARDGAQWRDEHALIAAEWLGKRGIGATRQGVLDVIHDVAHRNPYDPIRDILDECDWDGRVRLTDWLVTYCGVDADKAEWARIVGRKWLISGVARVYEPGCKADCMLILEGAQGRFKSTALDILGLGHTKEIRVRLDDKDAADALHSGAFIAVLTELDAFKRTTKAESIKAYLSALDDYFRRAYARVTTTHPRSIIFAATTNEGVYLTDPTGNRRFWPVTCGDIDIDALRRDVYLLWAEARHAYLAGESWWLEPTIAPLAEREQADRLMPDSWEEYIDEYLRGKTVITLKGLMHDGLQLGPDRQNGEATGRVTRYLLRLGWGVGIDESNGRRRKVYRRLNGEREAAE